MNVLEPEKIILNVAGNFANDSLFAFPALCHNDRIAIVQDESLKVMFYDIQRQKFIAEFKTNSIGGYSVLGDDLKFGIYGG